MKTMPNSTTTRSIATLVSQLRAPTSLGTKSSVGTRACSIAAATSLPPGKPAMPRRNPSQLARNVFATAPRSV